MADATNTIQVVISATDKASQTIKQTTNSLGGLNKLSGLVTGAMAAMGVAISARAVYQLEQLGAESLRAKTSLGFLMGSAEEATATITELAEATGGEVTQAQLAAQATELLTSGLATSREEMVRIIGAAEALGDVMGMSATQSIDALSRALMYKTPRALRQLGINVENVKKRQEELLETQHDLTAEQAFTEAALLEVESVLGRMGASDGAVYNSVDAIDRLTVAITELKTAAGEDLVPIFAAVADYLVDWIKYTPQQRTRMGELSATTLKAADSYEEYRKVLNRTATAEGLIVDYWGDLREKYGVEMIAQNYLLTRTEFELARGMQRSAEMAQAFGQGLSRTYPEMTKTGVSAAQLTDQLSPLADEAARLGRSFGELPTDLQVAADAFNSFDISKEAVWQMMMATGKLPKDAKALGVLAVQMGVAEASAVQQTIKMYELVEAYDAGELSARDLSIAMQELRAGTMQSSLDVARAQGQVIVGSDAARLRYDNMKSSVEEVDLAVDELPTEAAIDIHVTDADSLLEYLLTIRRTVEAIEGDHHLNFTGGGGGGGPIYMPSNAPYYNPAVTTPAEGGTQTTRESGTTGGGGSPYGTQNFNLTVNTTRDLFSVRHEFGVMSALGGQ